MPINTKIARPYAKAAFEYALEQQQIQAWADFLQLAAVVVNDRDSLKLITDPRVTEEQAVQFIAGVCQQNMDEKQHNFLQLLGKNRRLTILPDIAALFDSMQKDYDKTVAVQVISAFPVASAQQEKLKQALTIRLQKKVNLAFTEDESILGGAVIRAGDFVIDGSVKTQLERMCLILQE